MDDPQVEQATPPDQQMQGTAEGLLAFLNWAGRKGELASNTAASYRTAVTQVLEIDGENWLATPIAELDVERQLDRFSRLRASRYNSASLRSYHNRFKAAVASYLRYLESPADFRGGSTARPRPAERKVAQTPTVSAAGDTVGRETAAPKDSSLTSFPFPLRPGLMVYLSLPRDLRRNEAQRIGAFVASLAMDPPPELPPGS